jgi:hypothetical protein
MNAWTDLHLMTIRDRIDDLRTDAAAVRSARAAEMTPATRRELASETATRLLAVRRAFLARA